ncbi:YceG family protein [Candidatus Nomurabacteria bacterium]|nr:YceG family protein [Candidatus Nomurabacteria bacterium]
MIYLFSGDDVKNKHNAYIKFIKSIPKATETFFISRNEFNKMQVESLYSGSGLFFAKSAVIFSNVLEREELREFILEKLELMGESQNDFIFLEGKLGKPVIDAFKKARAEINIFELPKAKLEKFDNFLLANAFGQKDRLNLWIYFRMAVDRGVVMEELVGVLGWKAKDMILKKNFGKFSENELKNFVAKLSYLLPEARAKGEDAEAAFEQFLLEAF